jgi:hypothetical protein
LDEKKNWQLGTRKHNWMKTFIQENSNIDEKTPQNVTGSIYILSAKFVLVELTFWMTNQKLRQEELSVDERF